MLLIGFLSVLSCSLLAAGHFTLDYPPSLGFDDGKEDTGPCGGFDVVVNSSSTAIPVDSFPVAVFTSHPAGNWLYRATTNTQAPFNWTNLLPVVQESGLGAFCLPNLKIPSSFKGKPGVIQVIQAAADGQLYQCAAVNFIAGSNSSTTGCKNGTGVSATITNQNALDSSASSSATPSGTATATGTSASASATGKSGAERLGASMTAVLLLVALGLVR